MKYSQKTKKHFFILSFFIFGSLLLSACATLPAKEEPKNQNISWEKRTQLLSGITAWNIKALIAIRSKQTADSATLEWQQQKTDYTLLFFGPLGTNAMTLTGSPYHVELKTAQGKKITASTPELLLWQQTGWRLPVSNLFYWIRGLPVPHLPLQTQFDAYHHLIELTQQGWKIRFLQYTTFQQMDVPSKIFLENSDLHIKIIIKQWKSLTP